MDYVLMDFQQRANVRHYSFRGTTEDNQRFDFVVNVDLDIVLKHRIPIQEIPLLCRRLLEQEPVSAQSRKLTFSEEHMQAHVKRCEEEKRQAVMRRKGYFKTSAAAK